MFVGEWRMLKDRGGVNGLSKRDVPTGLISRGERSGESMFVVVNARVSERGTKRVRLAACG